MSRVRHSSPSGQGSVAVRPGRPRAWVARLTAIVLLVQAGSPAFVSACQRGAGGDEHGCPACRPVAAAAPACHAAPRPAPACHAAETPGSPASARPATQPCCFLDASPLNGQTAVPEVTLGNRDVQSLPLQLSGDPDGTTAVTAARERFVFPPGFAGLTGSGPPEALRHSILRL